MRFTKMTRSNLLWGAFFTAPLMLGIAVFDFWPIVQSLYLSFTEWGSFGNYEWNGLDNYRKLISDRELLGAFRNVVVYALIQVPFSIAIPIVVAVLLNRKIRGVSVYRTLFFLPVITMPVAISVVWKWLYNGDYGIINYGLSELGINGPRWLTDPKLALYSVIVVAIWSSIGYNMILFLSGLQGISSTYYEASSIDGANGLRQFFYITLPMLTPTIFFVTVISLIDALQVFDLIYVMIGPDSPVIEQTQSVVVLFFQHAFVLNEKGYASTIIMLLFVVIMIITLIQLRLQKRWVYYE
jgi:multiple sugar transport system permease protein